jgi:hypothetical protein
VEVAAAEDALVEEAALIDELADEAEPPQPNWMLLICHPAALLEKPDQTNPVTALPLAPEKELKGTVTVCVLPVRPLTP